MRKFSVKWSLARWRRRLKYRLNKHRKAKTPAARKKWAKLAGTADSWVRIREKQLEAATPLRLKALEEARKCIGWRETHGNNRGPEVDRVVRYAQGQLGEPYCVDGVIWSYGRSGSQAVKPGFPRAVRMMLRDGLKVTKRPRPGDIARFKWDHTGLVERIDGQTLYTVEFNTGVEDRSDNAEGGVARKVRRMSDVQDFLKVVR